MDGGTWWGKLIHFFQGCVGLSFPSDLPPVAFQNPLVALQELPIAFTGPSCSSPSRG